MLFDIHDDGCHMHLEFDTAEELALDDTTLDEVRLLIKRGYARRSVHIQTNNGHSEEVEARFILRHLGHKLCE